MSGRRVFNPAPVLLSVPLPTAYPSFNKFRMSGMGGRRRIRPFILNLLKDERIERRPAAYSSAHPELVEGRAEGAAAGGVFVRSS